MTKEEKRQHFLKLRDGLAEADRQIFSEQITQRILDYVAEQKPQTIFCYASFRSEPDTQALMEALLSMGKTLALPKCGAGGQMEFYQVADLAELTPGAYGILEPSPHELMLPEMADLILVPGCAFSTEGYRLGYGGGYYDRYLPRAKTAKAIGICFSCCVAEEIPAEKTDWKIQGIITEQMFVNFL